ncbi:MAG: dihydroorotase [Prevotellaceae bacterium]|jgi:dihydroorotase|nr:dihydroorotase [Prevotellaceae bacterium]
MILIHNATIVNERTISSGSVLLENDIITRIFNAEIPAEIQQQAQIIDASGKYLFPGVIDDHVHFRQPGLTHKGDIASESRAAVAGGVTSYMDMPNTVPQTTTIELLEEKMKLAAENSLANYSFFLGATNDNLQEIKKINPKTVCGLKLFMGSSTGNMLVNEEAILEQIFAESPVLLMIHAEDDAIIKANAEYYKKQLGDALPMFYHPLIRSAEACYKASERAISLAKKYNTRIHLAHISTEKELSLLDAKTPLANKRITAETCPQYLWFDDEAYNELGALAKCNPAIKTAEDREALVAALSSGKIDVVGTDHAPHLLSEKEGNYWQAVSGMPQIQHSLPLMLELFAEGEISLETVAEKMCHAPAELFRIERRGYIREGYFADLVLVEKNDWTVAPDNILSKCGWSPYEGISFAHRVSHTFVNGNLVYENGNIDDAHKGKQLIFNR